MAEALHLTAIRRAIENHECGCVSLQAEVERLTTQLEKCRWHSSLEELEDRVDTAMAVVRELAEALHGLYTLVEKGLLVRNMTNDSHFPSYMAEATEVVMALKKTTDALAHPLVQQAREEKG
mgnify:CR=1 FL=1